MCYRIVHHKLLSFQDRRLLPLYNNSIPFKSLAILLKPAYGCNCSNGKQSLQVMSFSNIILHEHVKPQLVFTMKSRMYLLHDCALLRALNNALIH